jgi:hypothetical protein
MRNKKQMQSMGNLSASRSHMLLVADPSESISSRDSAFKQRTKELQ